MSDNLPAVPDQPAEGWRPTATASDVKQALLLLPNLAKLVARLLRDPRIERREKTLALAAVGYAVSPLDLIPDTIPGIGRLDDLFVLAAALRHLIRAAGPEIVAEHWDGRGDVLYALESMLEAGAAAVPRRLRRLAFIGRLRS